MKFLLVIFAIATMAQLSMAGPLVRHKRSEAFTQIFEESLRKLRTFGPRTETLVTNMMKDMPRTHDYNKYIELFEGYLKDAETLKTTPGNCFEKSYAGLELTGEMVTKLLAIITADRSTAAAEVRRLLTINNGDGLANDLISYGTKLENIDVEKGLEELTESEAARVGPLLSDVC